MQVIFLNLIIAAFNEEFAKILMQVWCMIHRRPFHSNSFARSHPLYILL